MPNSSDGEDDIFDSVNAMADRLKLEGNERRKYVHSHMTRAGYRAEPQYVRDDADDDDGDDDGPWWGRRSKSRSGRQGAGQRRSREDDDFL